MDVGRLQGRRRYDYMEVIGRVEPGAETERTSGTRSRGRNASGTAFEETESRKPKPKEKVENVGTNIWIYSGENVWNKFSNSFSR